MNDPRFDGSHIFIFDGKPTNSIYNGDVLVWTAGRLADMYRLNGQQDSILALFNNLTDLLMNEGVVEDSPKRLTASPSKKLTTPRKMRFSPPFSRNTFASFMIISSESSLTGLCCLRSTRTSLPNGRGFVLFPVQQVNNLHYPPGERNLVGLSIRLGRSHHFGGRTLSRRGNPGLRLDHDTTGRNNLVQGSANSKTASGQSRKLKTMSNNTAIGIDIADATQSSIGRTGRLLSSKSTSSRAVCVSHILHSRSTRASY